MTDCSKTNTPSCCAAKTQKGFVFDPIFHGCLAIIVVTLFSNYVLIVDSVHVNHFARTIVELLSKMWWGVALGLMFVGLMDKIPRHYFNAVLGNGDSTGGLVRAMFAGLMFDLCSHGILMIGAKLYERGASFAQVVTFLIASPWNSFSLTLILIALIGLKWTLVFIAGSAVIALGTGLVINALTRAGIIPENPNKPDCLIDFDLWAEAKKDLSNVEWKPSLAVQIIKGGMHEARVLIKWLLLGIIMAACIRTFISPDNFAEWFAPTIGGLALTLLATTLIEVCSEGSSPIAAELVNRAHAPGNAFAFLMAGAATDYTEIMILKETTKSWKMAFIMPIVSVPQILILGYIINFYG